MSSPLTEQRRTKLREAEEAFVHEVERQLKEDGTRDRAGEESQAAEMLPSKPAAFVRHFLAFYKWPLLAMALLELGQAACQILIPKAVQRLIDSAAGLVGTGGQSVWTALAKPMKFFVLLNLGILVFSRSSGSLLVMVGPSLRRRVRNSLYRYLQSHSQRYFMGNFAGSLANRIAEVSHGREPLALDRDVRLLARHRDAGRVARRCWPRSTPGSRCVLGLWTLGYVAVSYVLAMRCREYAKAFAAARSAVSGKIVDAVTNVMNSKLFARDGARARLPQPLPRPRGEGGAPHVLVHGEDALVSVHRHACRCRSA